MVSCALRTCSSRSEVDTKKLCKITFHRFPKNPERRKLWIKFVSRGNWMPNAYSVLCSKHFLEQDFDRSSLNCVRLKENAVPTLYNQQEQFQQFPRSPKVRILSNIQVAPPVSETVTANFGTTPVVHISNIATSSAISKVVISPSSSTSEITPRKQKLLNSLSRTQKISSERKRKLISVRKKLFRREKCIANIKDVMAHLHRKNYIQEEVLDVLGKFSGPKEFLLRQYRKTKKKALPRSYSEELKTFALTLHFYSPAAYKYVRRTFDSCLPHPRTLTRWYQNINGEPGFTSEAFEALRLKAVNSDTKVICSLIMDEMAIRQHEEWVSGKNRCYGYVDMGTGLPEQTLAKDALVFLLNCVNGSWKIPIGYFLIAGITGEQKKDLVLNCLSKCHEVGIEVVSLTFDGAPVNLTMAKRLGCSLEHSNLTTTFKHPITAKHVAIILDPSHMIKLIRNTIGQKYYLVDSAGNKIEWRYFKELHNLQEKECFHLANKLRAQHINFCKQKMKVRLATQLFSKSVALAFEFCRDDLQMKEFIGVDATVKFVS